MAKTAAKVAAKMLARAPGSQHRDWIDPAVLLESPQPQPDTPALPSVAGVLWPHAEGDQAATGPATGPAWNAPSHIERRLSQRAETLWRILAGDETRPAASQLQKLLAPPFLGQAMLVEFDAEGNPAPSYIGEALAPVLGRPAETPAPAPAEGLTMTALGTRLLELAEKAARTGSPYHYQYDFPKPSEASGGHVENPLLLRAVALPFAPPASAPAEAPPGDGQQPCAASEPGAGRYVAAGPTVVITSWRELLSGEETRALHRELAAAMDWMHRQTS